MSYLCDLCGINFRWHGNLLRHKKKKHNAYLFNCSHCNYGCNAKIRIIRHLRDSHNLLPKSELVSVKRSCRIICPECKYPCRKYDELYSHLRSEHGTNIVMERFTFDGIQSFHEWKLKVEKETHSRYFAPSGRKKLASGSIREHFICHRSYSPHLKTEGRKKAVKSLNTNKISVACPSRILVEVTETGVVVEFISTHVGHVCEILRTTIPKDKRAKIAAKLKEGVSVERILQDIRGTVDPDLNNFERIHYIKRRDIRNIIRDFKLGDRANTFKENGNILAKKIENQISQTTQFLEAEIADTNRKYREELKSKLHIMLGYVETVSKNKIPNILKELDKILSDMKIPNNNDNPHCSHIPNKTFFVNSLRNMTAHRDQGFPENETIMKNTELEKSSNYEAKPCPEILNGQKSVIFVNTISDHVYFK